MSELDLKPLQLSWRTATTATPRVQGSHWTVPSYSGRGHQPPCQEQEPEHCSAICQETARTAALKLNVARQTYIIIYTKTAASHRIVRLENMHPKFTY